jgi:hypothetical protein
MRRMNKLLTLVLALTLTFALALPAAAAAGTKTVSVTYCKIVIMVDGQTITPVDGTGKAVEPFALNGSTYLPLRAVAGALGLNVAWNGKTSTVALTTGGKAVSGTGKPVLTDAVKTVKATYSNIKITLDGKAITPKDAAGKAVEPFAIAGTTYLPVRAVANALGVEVGWEGAINTVYIGKQPTAYDYYLYAKYTVESDGTGKDVHYYGYDDQMRLISDEYHGSLAVKTSSDYTETITYDDKNMTAVDVLKDSRKEMTLDARGNVTKTVTYNVSSSGAKTLLETDAYTYDSNDRLLTHRLDSAAAKVTRTETYTYDSKGNVLSIVTVVDGETTTDRYTYNADGNVDTHVSSAAAGTMTEKHTYTWDSQKRITGDKAVQTYSGYSATGTLFTEYIYSDGGKVTENHYTVNSDGSQRLTSSIVSTYDEDGLLAEQVENGTDTVYQYYMIPRFD